MFYTREQIDILEKYRKTFETALYSGFARNVGSIALKEIEEVYDEAYGSHYSYNSGCGACVLAFIKRVGEPFLKDSAAYATQDRLAAEKAAEEEEKKQQEQQEADEEEKKALPSDIEVKEELKENTPEPPKTNKRTRKEKK